MIFLDSASTPKDGAFLCSGVMTKLGCPLVIHSALLAVPAIVADKIGMIATGISEMKLFFYDFLPCSPFQVGTPTFLWLAADQHPRQ